MRIGSLFSGYGGLDMAVRSILGGEVLWHCDIDRAASTLLAHHYPTVPNLGDITAVDWSTVEPVDVLTGGSPCQDVSTAGRRAGFRPDTRSGLWSHMAYAISQLRPRLVVFENVRGLLSARAVSDVEPCPWCVGDSDGVYLRALGAVLGDLASVGYDARWCGLRASDVGVPHERFRVFLLAWPASDADRAGSQGTQPTAGPDLPDGGAAADVDRAPADARHGPLAERPRETWREGGERSSEWSEFGGGRSAVAHPDSQVGRQLGTIRGRDALQGPELTGRPSVESGRLCGGGGAEGAVAVDWGQYEPAIQRWEHVLGRPAPGPTIVGKRGGRQLSPAFVEWLMGLDLGHVTAVPGLSRTDQLRLLGNGVVPQQGEAALRWLLTQGVGEVAA